MTDKVPSRLVVVDSSVYRAAGGEGATVPMSKNCREVLMAILTICHRVFLSDVAHDEWKRNRSRFSHTWLTRMYARRKVVRTEVAPDSALRSAIAEASAPARQIAAMEKDAHLLEAALISDGRIIALDEQVRRLFVILATSHPRIAPILWVNPDRAEDATLTWLARGAPMEPARALGAAALGAVSD